MSVSHDCTSRVRCGQGRIGVPAPMRPALFVAQMRGKYKEKMDISSRNPAAVRICKFPKLAQNRVPGLWFGQLLFAMQGRAAQATLRFQAI